MTAIGDDRDKDHRERDQNRHERRDDGRERDKEWRENLRDRKSYKERAKADRDERDDFERFCRDRGYRREPSVLPAGYQ